MEGSVKKNEKKKKKKEKIKKKKNENVMKKFCSLRALQLLMPELLQNSI